MPKAGAGGGIACCHVVSPVGHPSTGSIRALMFTLLTHDHIIKFADGTTAVGLVSKNDEPAYREEAQRLADWCRTSNLSLNVDKTKEMVVDFRRTRRDHSPLHIDGSTVKIVKSAKEFTWQRISPGPSTPAP
ncbi:hypothetical protein NFI96_007502 [Prochilodus magdalenae]|nr:hypothetical protein NFI96_007502 [Prochilodus magdalenae]